ncbi:LANO_0E06326g1_1 [Lachancea nothofagi CBS 11611]|uniref:Exocyst complex component EXO84 n=1 Tax=Lachancea nothofagi CBS 11611 TaxID=1266666 RepID=A0A1G4JTR2_9SACH|nr:LANO_0E06326g1_1 [Lachancea nothofagi CBS 11611]
MVELSLRKARTNWKQLSSPVRAKNRASNDGESNFKANPYQDLEEPANYAQLPTIGSKERNKVGTSMQRRLSFHAPKHGPPTTDYAAVPLPNNLDIEQAYGNNVAPNTRKNRSHSNIATPRGASKSKNSPTQLNGVSLRQILSDPNFEAKDYVTTSLGNASALEIDQFTSELNDLALEVTDEVKENISKSYSQVLQVNRDLSSASTELKHLRTSIGELQEVMAEFETMAEKRLQLERAPSQRTRSEQQSSLLPAAKASQKRDRTSVLMLEKMWKNELSTLFKAVEGAQKFISPLPGRHILLEASDWYEVNAATLKPLKAIHIFLLNDMIMIAARNLPNKQHELIACHCHTLRDTTIDPQPENRIVLNFANRSQCLIQTHKTRQYDRLVSTMRGAKDDLNVISQAEEENTRKIRDSYTYMQATHQTPGRDLTLSPSKSHARNSSLGNATPGPNNDSNDSFLLQSLSTSMKHPSQGTGGQSGLGVLGQLDEQVENFDIVFARRNYKEAIAELKQLEESLKQLNKEAVQDNQVLLNILQLKVSHRHQLMSGKLTHLISTEISEFSNVTEYVHALISLNYTHDALEQFLQNRSKYIHELTLKVGFFHNPTYYLAQIAVIRFQTIKKVVSSVQELFKNTEDNFSSTLVSWCSDEIDKHFTLINKQFLNVELIPPSSIKSSRRQIDELKAVGLNFVYKLDDFIRKNSERIG